MPDFTEDQINDTADKLASEADKGQANKFYDDVNSLVDEVKKGNLSPKSYNEILRKAEGRQTGADGFDELTLVENGQDVTCANGKHAKLDAAGLNYKYFGTARNTYDANGKR